MKKVNKVQTLIIILVCLVSTSLSAQVGKIKPVTPKPSDEATALLTYLQSLSGKYTLSGQHNFPASGDRNTQFAGDYIGETPVVWSQDFGFAKDGDKDSYLARPAIIKEAIRQHKLGAIVNLCWHAVPPTASEPVTFQPLPGYDSTKLASVQGRLPDQQFKDLLTPGTAIYKQWAKQVDEIASYLKQLQDAKVPVVWRPYHEMNGDWFWWGGRYKGKYTTAALYRQIFDRMVNYHKLNNLIWVWSIDRPSKPGREFANYYPGTKYLDILAIDIYGNDFNQKYYDDLRKLSEGKPITLGEVGNPPSLEIISTQPDWIYWVVWSGMAKGTPKSDYEKLSNDNRILFMEDSAYVNGTREYRMACGLPPLSQFSPADFTGEWFIDECESIVQSAGPGLGTPYKLDIKQNGNELKIKSTAESEWSGDDVTDETFTLDGKDVNSVVFMGAPRVQNANWSEHKDTLTIKSVITFNFNGRESEFIGSDTFSLKRRDKKLVIVRQSSSFNGQNKSVLVYNKGK